MILSQAACPLSYGPPWHLPLLPLSFNVTTFTFFSPLSSTFLLLPSLSLLLPPSPSQQEEGSTDAFSALTFCASVKTLHSKAGWLSVRARFWR